jgi:hypothetical protein
MRCHLSSRIAVIATYLFLFLCDHLHATFDDGKKEEEVRREQFLKNMKRSAAQFTISPAADRKHPFKWHETPVMRWTDPEVGLKDGAVFLWIDRGRPQAILKLYTRDNKLFAHEWQSLSENPIVAEGSGKAIWNPSDSGIKFHELPDAPKPAESPLERLRQMKAVAGKFTVTCTPSPQESKPFDLRLLIQHLIRFEANEESKCLDGALFAFANGTDPQGLLLIEARKSDQGERYYYAIAKMSTGAVAAKYGEKEIFTSEKYDFRGDPKQTFLLVSEQPVPKE